MDRVENHLNYNQWLRGIYEEAKSIAASDKSAVLEEGLSEDDLRRRADIIRYGDYKYGSPIHPPELINHEAAAVPEGYFTFLFIIGGFSCRSVRLYNLGYDYLSNQTGRNRAVANVVGPSVREKVITGEASSYHVNFELCYPTQLTIGVCDKGDYVYDRRYDSYSLIGSSETVNFSNCEEMLNHALQRARKNIEEKWTAAK